VRRVFRAHKSSLWRRGWPRPCHSLLPRHGGLGFSRFRTTLRRIIKIRILLPVLVHFYLSANSEGPLLIFGHHSPCMCCLLAEIVLMFFSIHGGVGARDVARAEDKERVSWTRNMVGVPSTDPFARNLVMLLGCMRGIIRRVLIVNTGERWWTRRDDIVCTVMRIGGPFISCSIISHRNWITMTMLTYHHNPRCSHFQLGECRGRNTWCAVW